MASLEAALSELLQPRMMGELLSGPLMARPLLAQALAERIEVAKPTRMQAALQAGLEGCPELLQPGNWELNRPA